MEKTKPTRISIDVIIDGELYSRDLDENNILCLMAAIAKRNGKDPAEVIYDMAYCVAASTVLTPLRDSIVGPYKPPPAK